MGSDSTISERLELAKFCSSRDWSKAIRVLDSLLSRSCVIQDLCNRAFCYSQLELHKHVIKDCGKALQLDPTLLQAYILKGCALSALGRKEEGLLVWEQGYGYAVRQSTDLKQLLELEELLAGSKKNKASVCEDQTMESCSLAQSLSDSGSDTLSKISGTPEIGNRPSDRYEICNKFNGTSEAHSKSSDTSETCSKTNGTSENQSKSIDTSENCSKSNGTSETQSKFSGTSEIFRKGSISSDITSKRSDAAKKSVKVFGTGIPKTKSISLNFRLSRGIALVKAKIGFCNI